MGQLSPAEVLRRAADLIEPEGAWTQGAAARSAAGTSVDAHAEVAVCFCVFGALAKASGESPGYAAATPASRFLEDVVGEWPSYWNDAAGRTQAEVVAALRQAADQAEARP